MSTRTGIEWTDATWNVLVGCTKVSQGCKHCYAKTLHDRRHKAVLAGKALPAQYAEPFERVQFLAERLDQPLRWRTPRRIFVNALSDPFHEQVDDAVLDAIFGVMALCGAYRTGHVFQVLTKRPARALAYLTSRADGEAWADALAAAVMSLGDSEDCHVANSINGVLGHGHNVGWPLANVWLGVSVEHQGAANERIPLLLDTPAAVRFLSCEPLLADVDLSRLYAPECGGLYSINGLTGEEYYPGSRRRGIRPGVDWVIVGGESGPGARPMDLRWASSIVAQCKAAGVPVFVKQLGAVPMEPEADWRGRALTRVLSANNRDRVPEGFVPLACGGDAKGGRIECWPAELQVREFPRAAAEVR